MSDFFTRLAERTLGLAPTIQPMIPSLFAPEPDVAGDMLLEITEESETGIAADNFSGNAAPTGLAQDATATMHSTQPTYPAFRSAPALQQQSAFGTMGERQARRMQDHLRAHNETATTDTRMQSTKRSFQYNQPATPVSSAQVQTPSFAPMNAQTLRVARRTGEIPDTTATFSASSMPDNPLMDNTYDPHLSMLQATSEQQATRGATPHEQIVSHHTLVGVSAPNPPSTSSFSETRRAQQMQKTQQLQQPQQPQLETMSPEPAIQVTIGRVEVRAVNAPPTSARPQQPSDKPPAMSLDEYLRQQERGGGRR